MSYRIPTMIALLLALLCAACAGLRLGHEFRQAALDGDIAKVKRLLGEGVDINSKDAYTGHTALIWAAQEGRTDIVKLLLERGADIEVKSKSRSGWTARMWAAEAGHTDIVKLLDEGSGPAGLYGDPSFNSPMSGKVGWPFSAYATAPCRRGEWSANIQIATGALPPGLRLLGPPSTRIEGVPTRPGNWNFSVRFSNLTCAGKTYKDVTQNVAIVTEGSAAPGRVPGAKGQ